jgi:hypothetical protein
MSRLDNNLRHRRPGGPPIADIDINRCGGWSRDEVIRMDQRFRAAMERAISGHAAATEATPDAEINVPKGLL